MGGEWQDVQHLLDAQGIRRTLVRMAHEIVERYGGVEDLALIGIRTGGVYLAERLHRRILEIEEGEVPLGSIDITLYRDDVLIGLPQPEVGRTEVDFSLTDKIVVLIDDVLFTGRTVRAALDQLIDFGRPRAIRLAVLADRGHREFPIQADHIGLAVETARDESVQVRLKEHHGPDEVVLRRRK